MKTLIRVAMTVIIGASCMIAAGCTSCGSGGLKGTYSDAAGSMLLELKSGGKANFTWMGQIADCTYTSSGTQVTVNCRGEAGTTVFTVHDDGSLTGPPGSFIPVLTKRKS
jgi:hypothetical protein